MRFSYYREFPEFADESRRSVTSQYDAKQGTDSLFRCKSKPKKQLAEIVTHKVNAL